MAQLGEAGLHRRRGRGEPPVRRVQRRNATDRRRFRADGPGGRRDTGLGRSHTGAGSHRLMPLLVVALAADETELLTLREWHALTARAPVFFEDPAHPLRTMLDAQGI